MAKEDKYYNGEVTFDTNWGGAGPDNKPMSGQAVQKFIKDTFDTKVGHVGYCETTKTYVLTKNVEAFEKYRQLIVNEDTKLEAMSYIIGNFNAPAQSVISITTINPELGSMSVLDGTKGVAITFKLTTKNAQDNSEIRESYNFKISNTSNSQKPKTGIYEYGLDEITVNVDDLLGVGTNSLTINVTGQDSGVSSFKTVVIKVIKLSVKDEYDISTVYDFSDKLEDNLIVPYSITTNAETKIKWFIDYQFIGETVHNLSTTNSFKFLIKKGDYADGVHSLMYYAEYNDITAAEPFRTSITYKNFFVTSEAFNEPTPLFSMAFDVPYSKDFFEYEQKPNFYGVKQYDTINLEFAIYTKKSSEVVDVKIKKGDATEYITYSTLEVESNKVYEQKIVLDSQGTASVKLVSNQLESFEIGEFDVMENTSITPPTTNNLMLFLDASNKNNEQPNKDKWVSTVGNETYEAIFKGFTWTNNNGWRDGKLVIGNGSEVEIPCAPFSNGNNFTNGFTFEIEFSTSNVYDENGEICRIQDDNSNAGIVITASEAIFNVSEDNKVSTKFKSGKTYRISFVKTMTGTENTLKNERFVKIYVNGVLCGVEEFAFNTNFINDSTIKIKGTKDAQIELSSIRIYRTALNDDDILNNYMFYRTDVVEKTNLYARNNIYNDAGTIDIDKLNQQIPVMIFHQIIEEHELHEDLEMEFSDKGVTIYLDVEYKDLSDPTGKFNFYFKNAGVRPQGTSSMKYPKKNYRIYTQRDSERSDIPATEVYIGEEYSKFKKDDGSAKSLTGKKRKYSFTDNAAPVKCWCLKADFAESSGTHNTGIARYWNSVLFGSGYKTNAQKIATENGYKYDVRTTVDGFPIALFYKKLDGTIQFLGKYNFNNDKSTEDVFGFTGGDELDDKPVRYLPIGYNKPIIQKGEAEIINADSELYVKNEDGTLKAVYSGEQVFDNPTIDSELEVPLYYEEKQANGKTLYYKLETSDMFDNARMECWELLNSGTDLALFRRKLTGDLNKDIIDEDQEKVGYFGEDGTPNESFESRFPDCGETYHTYNLQRFIDWMVDCLYLKTIVVDEDDNMVTPENMDNTKTIKGKLVPMTQEELKKVLGDKEYKDTLTIQLKSKDFITKDTFKFVPISEDGNTISYTEVDWEQIKDDVEKEEEPEMDSNGAIIEIPVEEYRSIILSDEKAQEMGSVEVSEMPKEKTYDFITLKIANEDGSVETYHYCWGYRKVYYTDDYRSLTEEVLGYEYVYDINTKKYYIWGDFRNFSDFFEPKTLPNTPSNRALKFAVEKYDHFNLDMIAAYYIYLMRFGGVDQTVKNAMLTTEGSDDNTNLDLPSKWYFINYDNDTVMGVKNDGRLVFDPYITRDSIEGNQMSADGNVAYCYAGRNSTMWNNLEMDADFMSLVPTVDNKLYTSNELSYKTAIEMFNEKQSGKWSERVYNWDAKVKYIDTYTQREDDMVNDENAEFNYLLNVQGPRSAHREWWLSKRFNIFDSNFTTGSFKKEVVTFKCNGPTKDDVCEITSGEDIYYGYYKNNPESAYKTSAPIKPGDKWYLTVTENSTIGDPHAMFGAPNIEGINFRPIAYRITELQMSGIKSAQIGTKLKSLLIGDHTTPKINTNFSVLGGVSNMEKLEIMDMTGCQGLSLNGNDVGALKNLKELYLAGSGTKSVSFIDGGNIEKMELPIGLTDLTLVDTFNLTWDDIKFIDLVGNSNAPDRIEVSDFSRQKSLTTISITNCDNLLSDYDMFLTWLEEREKNNWGVESCILKLDKINWVIPSNEIERLFILKNVGKSNSNLVKNTIKGRIEIDKELTLNEVNTLLEIFGNDCFEENAAIEIVARPGIYIAKYGVQNDYVLEGNKTPNKYEILTIGFKDDIVNVNVLLTEFDEKNNPTRLGSGINVNVDNETMICSVTVDELGRIVSKITIAVVCDIVDDEGVLSQKQSEPYSINVKKLTYPTNGNIIGVSSITNYSEIEYNVRVSDENGNNEFNGNYYFEWTLSGEEFENGHIKFVDGEYNGTTCKVVASELTNKTFNLTVAIKRVLEGKIVDVFPPLTKTIILKNNNILLTYQENPALYSLLEKYGFINAERGYLELAEARNIAVDTPSPTYPTKQFKDIFAGYVGIKSNESLDKYDILFEDFSILSEFTNITEIPNGMFKDCEKLLNVTLPPYCYVINDNAFSGCKKLYEVNIGENTTTIGKYAFNSCQTLVSMDIPDNINNISEGAFSGCTNLKTLTLGNGITEIPVALCDSCKKLETVVYGNIEKINDRAFKECLSLQTLNIPETLNEIVFTNTTSPFMGCNSVVFTGGNDKYGVSDGTLYFNDTDRKWILKQNPMLEINSDEELYAAAYSLCGMKINDLVIPSNIKFNGTNILNGSQGNSITFTTMFNTHVLCDNLLASSLYDMYIFHASETTIPNRCFNECTSLKNITIPNTITTIGDYAFAMCSSISTLTIPSNVTKIGSEAFRSMMGLREIYFLNPTPPNRGKDDILYNEDDFKNNILADTRNVFIYVNGDSYNDYVNAWGDYQELICITTLPSEGYFRIVKNANIYYGDDVTIGGVKPFEQLSNGYYHFNITSTVNNTAIKIGNDTVGNFVSNYDTIYYGNNKSLYVGKGIDFTRGIYGFEDVSAYLSVANSTPTWSYDSQFKALRSPSKVSVLHFTNVKDFVEDGYIYMTLGQTSESSYDYLRILNGNPNDATSHNIEIDLIDVRYNANKIGKSEDGLYGIKSNFIKIRIPYKDEYDYYLMFTKDTSGSYYSDSCWIYTIGNPVFVEPELNDEYVDEIVVKVSPITYTNSDGEEITVYPPQGVKIIARNSTYFEQEFLLGENGTTIIRLPKNDTYTIEGSDYRIGDKPYYFRKPYTLTTDGSISEINLSYERLFGTYHVTTDGELVKGTNVETNKLAYYIYADNENDFYISKKIQVAPNWSSGNVDSEDTLYVTGELSLYYDNTNGYENTKLIREMFKTKALVIDSALKFTEYNDIIEWYVPSYSELNDVYSNMSIALPQDKSKAYNIWTSNIKSETNAWVLSKQANNTVYKTNNIPRNGYANENNENVIMFFGRIKL